MGPTALKQLLRSFCNNSYWYYAVFWKINYQNRGILTWEDGYCDHSKSTKHMGSMTDDIHPDNDKKFSSCYGTNIYNGHSGSCSVEPAVADMSHRQYSLGEGTVGRVANSGTHSWVFLENIFTNDVFSTLINEGPGEWLIQYASGIKTILLVPVLPFGVLQLGSLHMVAEDLSMVAFVKDGFSALHCIDGITSIASDKGDWTPSGSVLVSNLFENLHEQPSFTANMLEIENYEATDDVKPPVSTSNQFVIVEDVPSASRKLKPGTRHSGNGHKCDIQAIDFKEPFAPLDQSICSSEVVEMGDGHLFDLFSLESQFPACTQLRNHDTGFFEATHLGFQSYSADNIVEPPFGHNFVTKKEYGTEDDIFSFPDDCELRKALGPAFLGESRTNEFLCISSDSIMNATSSLMQNRDFNEDDIEHLLETMIANLYDNSDDALSIDAVNAGTTSMSGNFAHSAQQCSQSESSTIIVDNQVPWIFPESAAVEIGTGNLTSFSSSNSMVINKLKGHDISQPRKGVKRYNSSRRIKFSANPRQRPRDRQLIQDRIKELREIVPNGAKCSIDGLLEKTIRHMLYLQRVTDQAEKLKQLVQQEDSDSKNCSALESDALRQNGVSWAFDIRSELQMCPIVVEDLDPGHMLIEMLCNDMGLFLEIAQVIRHLELTILKGVIERHLNDSWAHFIVQTPRGFHRMDVFWPLMHLLQRKRNPISSRI